MGSTWLIILCFCISAKSSPTGKLKSILDPTSKTVCILYSYNVSNEILFPLLQERLRFEMTEFTTIRDKLNASLFDCANYHRLYQDIFLELISTILLKAEEIMSKRISCALNADIMRDTAYGARATFFLHYFKAYIEKATFVSGEMLGGKLDLYPKMKANYSYRAYDIIVTQMTMYRLLPAFYKRLRMTMWKDLEKTNMNDLENLTKLLRKFNVTKATDHRSFCKEIQLKGERKAKKSREIREKYMSQFFLTNILILLIAFYFKAVDYDFLRFRTDSEFTYRGVSGSSRSFNYSIFRDVDSHQTSQFSQISQ